MADGFTVQKVDGRYWADLEQMIRVVNSAIKQSNEEDRFADPTVSLVNLASWLDKSIQAFDDSHRSK